ncbi:MAG TPA: M10 family metallopeptidase, partial [Caulobacteraceae bacterium]|nr:M10 family metallopeptidase [Caulobacteraceae bacterium]
FVLELSGGTSYDFTLAPTNQDATTGPDLLFEVYDSSGALLNSYDGGSFGATETATFTPVSSGTYYVNVKGWTPVDIGEYTVTAAINNDPGETGGTPLAALNWGGDDNIVDTDGVTDGGVPVIHVYFSQTGDLPYGSIDDPVLGVSWEQYQKDAAFQAFAQYENVINIKFVEVATREEADFIMAATASAPVILGRMRPPNEPNEGLGEFNILADSWSEEGLVQGGFGFITLIHELGHAMGLAHPHDTGGGSEVMQGVTGDLATGYGFGAFGLNQGVFTTMSYNDGWDEAPHGGASGNGFGYQGTMMALDVAMLQIKYGANTTYQSGDNVYALPTANAAGTFYACIWDTGGVDWITAGAGMDVVIDLRPATIQYEVGGGGFVSYAAGIHGGFTIAQGVIIENAVGGAGDDTITGNDADNDLEGGGGNDLLSGGLGVDIVSYTTASAGVEVNLSLTGAQATGGAGTDTLSGFESLRGSDFGDELTGTDGANSLFGGDGDDFLYGGLGADVLDGGDGRDAVEYRAATSAVRINLLTGVHVGVGGDSLTSIEVFDLGSAADNFVGLAADETVRGHDGNDVLNGLGGADTLIAGNGDDRVNGGDGDDSLQGQAGADRIDAGTGADVVSGGLGDDHIHGRDGDDVLDGGAGADTLIGGYGVDVATYRLSTAAVTLDLQTGVHTGDAAGDTFNSVEYFVLTNHADTLVGSNASDTIRGMGGDDVISGGLGHDGLSGGLGVDSLNGGDGRDTLNGDAGDDVLTGGAHADKFWFSGSGFGADTITDFHNGLDRIRVTGVAGVDDFSDLAVAANGSGWAVITFPDGSTVTLEGVTTAQVDAADFAWS